MTTGHLSETALQQYALDESAAPMECREHIAACDNCRAEAMTYRLLFAGIKEQPEPAFDFDVAGLVLAQLPAEPAAVPGALTDELAGGPQGAGPGMAPAARRRFGKWSLSTWLQAFVFSCTVAVPLYLFRRNISNVFTEVSVFFMYVIVAAAATAVFFQMRSMYRKYRRQLRILNYY